MSAQEVGKAMNRFECDFANSEGETRVISVQLTAAEIEKAGGRELYLWAYALKHAYASAPAGYCHVARGIHAVAAH